MAATKSFSTCSRLARAQQPVVDEHAGQLVTDGLLHQRRRHRGVDAAGQAADDAGLADLRAHRGDQVVDDVRRGPLPRQARPAEQEVLEHLLAERRVQHLGVPLHAVEAGARRPRTRRRALRTSWP